MNSTADRYIYEIALGKEINFRKKKRGWVTDQPLFFFLKSGNARCYGQAPPRIKPLHILPIALPSIVPEVVPVMAPAAIPKVLDVGLKLG